MVFDEDILRKIAMMGSDGWSLHKVAAELNMLYSDLEKLRAEDEKLNEALTDCEKNFDQYQLSKIIESPDRMTQKAIFEYLIKKKGLGGDNKIIIERV